MLPPRIVPAFIEGLKMLQMTRPGIPDFVELNTRLNRATGGMSSRCRGSFDLKRVMRTGHYSIDSSTVRAHVSAAGGKGGLIDALLAARGAGSPVSFTAWLTPSDDRSPST